MVKIQKMVDGSFFVVIPKELIRLKNWGKGDEMGFFLVGGEYIPVRDDIIFKKIRNAEPKNEIS